LHLTDCGPVRAGIHHWSGAARLARFPVEIVPCDVLNPGQLAEALTGVTCVIHCAKGPYASIVEGTGNLLEAAWRQGVGRVVHVSTTEVYGNPSGQVDERFPCQKTGQPYGDAKVEAEALCWQYAGRGLPLTVIRPPIVYGPFSKTWTVEIALRLHSGKWGLFQGLGEGDCNLIYISDLVSGILLAARDERAVGEAFNLNGRETPSWNEYFQRFNAALGLPALPVIETREAGLRAFALEPVRTLARFAKSHFEGPIRQVSTHLDLAKRGMKALEKSLKMTPRLADLSLFGRRAVYITTKARTCLGFQPKVGLDEGLDMAVRWLDQVGRRGMQS
jgi:nucleoside-diphosphate-sugar epimerase